MCLTSQCLCNAAAAARQCPGLLLSCPGGSTVAARLTSQLGPASAAGVQWPRVDLRRGICPATARQPAALRPICFQPHIPMCRSTDPRWHGYFCDAVGTFAKVMLLSESYRGHMNPHALLADLQHHLAALASPAPSFYTLWAQLQRHNCCVELL